MGRVRFVEPEVVRLPLSDGDWIDVKKQLTVGEGRRISGDIRRRLKGQDRENPTVGELAYAQTVAYLVAWSFVDKTGAPVPVTEGAIDQLDTETWEELRAALIAHQGAVEDEKKTRRMTTSSATSLQFAG